MIFYCKFAGILFFMFPVLLFSQDSEIKKLEQNAAALFQKSDSLYNQLAELATESEIITQRIQMYQKVEDLNPRQHRNLEKQMRNAQTLEAERDEIQTVFRETLDQFQQGVQKLIQQMDLESDSLVNAPEQSDPQMKDQIVKRLQYLINKKQQWAQAIEPIIQNEIPAFSIRANEWDTAEKLATKGDLILDQEDRLRQEVQLIDKRIKSLEDEKRIRTRVEELASSMDIFNEEEELINQIPVNGQAANYLSYRDGEKNNVGESFDSWAAKPANLESMGLNPLQDILSASSGEKSIKRTPENIQASIEYLEQHRDRMKSQADSLDQRAKWFHQEAENN